MKKTYNKPTLENVALHSDDVFTLSTGLNANITWGEVEGETWNSLFGE